MKFEIELPRTGLPSGLEVAGIVYKRPVLGEWFLSAINDTWEKSPGQMEVMRLVATVKPAEVWEPATVEDAIRALRGEVVKCRVWDCDSSSKRDGVLSGCAPGYCYPWFACVTCTPGPYEYCEVLRECK